MRSQILKLSRGHSTKAERRLLEVLKKNRIKFRTKVKIKGHEVDFLIGRNIIELRNANQNPERNKLLIEAGYNLFYLNSKDVCLNEISNFLKNFLN